ncbi:MAG: hypothetical protein OXT09_28750 [Myxococcales bacterium]|nr:hypothetical protein [Myxococcales bacterium]
MSRALWLWAYLALAACGGDDGPSAADLAGAWFACTDDSCEELARDGFELTAGGGFTTLRLSSGGLEDAEYCEIPFGTFEYGGGALTLMPEPGQDSQEEPRTVGFEAEGDRATLIDEGGDEIPYARVSGESTGACTGVLDR